MTSTDIERAVAKYFNFRVNLIIPRVSWGFNIHECDLLIMTKSGYLYEVEIKVSRADLIRDSFKSHGHLSSKIKKLYFAMPEDILGIERKYIPERAGILSISFGTLYVNIIREAETQKTEPLTIKERYKLARLGAMRIWRCKL